jgi:hypothetical protein
MDDDVDSKKDRVQAAGLGLVEKASEPRWALQLAVAALYVDLVLLWQAKHGLIQWSARTDELMQNLGLAAAGVVGFAVLAAIVLPTWGYLCRRVVMWLATEVPWLGWLWKPENDRPSGSVRPYKLKSQAIAKESDFMWSRWKEHDEATTKRHADQLQIGSLMVGALTLGSIDWAAQWMVPGSVSLIGAVERALPSQAYGQSLLAAAVLLSCAVLRWAWFSGWDLGWVHYPPLSDDFTKQALKEPAYRSTAAKRRFDAQHASTDEGRP